ncbi:SAM hydrolase/SAM-dependent halogenase family protein [Haloparvum sp. PAK95]|uniref:SAM hydrolase/SAM-dependent halogenase family protein n=1 Tax=Haloparvum sp. PAK95 TaxID=3418962 RepID=UPI003D2EA954
MITLASDFGSPYPAAMKGVISRRTDARMLDVAHDLPRGDPRAGAFWLRFVLPEFPPAVHCAVVDPGVGTDRAALVVRAGEHAIVAPDNGLAIPAARELAAGTAPEAEVEHNPIEVFEIEVESPASATFHGRDVFAPMAAEVHEAGVDELHTMDRLSHTQEFVDIAFPQPSIDRNAAEEPIAVEGEVLVVDTFGNVVTNIPGEVLRDRDTVEVNGERVKVRDTFGEVDRGEKLVTVGSHGYVECDVNDGRGDERFRLSPRQRVQLAFE